MDHQLPFYRQFSTRLLILLFIFVLTTSAAIGLYYLQGQTISGLTQQHIPKIKAFNQRQALIIKQNLLIDTVTSQSQLDLYRELFTEIEENLQEMAEFAQNNDYLINRLFKNHNAQLENINRISDNYRRNKQLTDSSIIQLTIVKDSLANLITKQVVQQTLLKRQLAEERQTDRVTSIRAQALAQLTQHLSNNRALQHQVINTLVLLSDSLNQVPLLEFDYIQQQMQVSLNAWLTKSNSTSTYNGSEKATYEQIVVLNNLLFTEQNVFAKLRGQLRLMTQYFNLLAEQRQQLVPLLNESLTIDLLVDNTLEQQAKKWLQQFDISIKAEHFWVMLLTLFLLTFVIYSIVLLSVSRKLKQLGQASVLTVKHMIAGQTATPPSEEVSLIIREVEQLVKPKHNDNDYLALEAFYSQQLQCFYRHNSTAYWHFSALKRQNNAMALQLLGMDNFAKEWRQYFTRQQIRQLLLVAREAKASSQAQSLNMTNQQGETYFFTVEYTTSGWQGTITCITELQVLQDNNEKIREMLVEQKNKHLEQWTKVNENFLASIAHIMLWNQQYSLSEQDGQQGCYQYLTQLFLETDNQQLLTRLTQEQSQLTLLPVNLMSELQAFILNVEANIKLKASLISLAFSEQVVVQCIADAKLLQQLLEVLINYLFTDTQCSLYLDVVDKSTAKQVVRFNFTFEKVTKKSELNEKITVLINDDIEQKQLEKTELALLNTIMKVLNVTNKQSRALDESISFSFDLPFIIETQQPYEQPSLPYLNKANVLVVASNGEHGKEVIKQLKSVNNSVELLTDLSLFQRYVSVKRLSDKQLDALILTPEVYLSDFESIEQHWHTLPKRMRPKLMVIQPECNIATYRTGMFNQYDSAISNLTLALNLETLLASNTDSNLVIPSDTLIACRHSSSHVELLLAVKNPSKHHLLIRLLRWLGLQVKLVANKANQNNLWRSGRFTILISEFYDADIASELALPLESAGLYIAAQEYDETAELTLVATSLKLVGLIEGSPALDVKIIEKLLLPWLKPNTTEPSVQKLPNKIVHEQKISYISDEDTAVAECEHAFDLAMFAEHQGSPFLAAYMLDDYLEDIRQLLDELSTAIDSSELSTAQQALTKMIKLAKLLAATQLQLSCQQLMTQLLAITSASDSPIEHQILLSSINEIKYCYHQLFEFAQAI